MRTFVTACLIGLGLASQASAQTFLVSGHLDDGDAPADGVFTVDLAIDDGDTPIWSETQPGVIVVDGFFAVDAGAVTPLDVSPPATATLTVTIDGDALPKTPLSRLLRATRVDRAITATTAATTAAVGSVTEATAVTAAKLSTSGAAPLPFSALQRVPAGVSDGDTGRDITALANGGLTLTARTLALGNVDGSKLATGSVTRTQLPTTISGTQIAAGAITGAKVKDGTLTGANVTGITDTEVAGTPIFEITALNCNGAVRSLTTASTCPRFACTDVGGAAGREGCDDPSVCETGALVISFCFNTRLGVLAQ